MKDWENMETIEKIQYAVGENASTVPMRWNFQNVDSYIPSSFVVKRENILNPPSTSPAKREQKRRAKPKDGTVLYCSVCNDRALGYNFNAISCESCKAFFRRNALKKKITDNQKRLHKYLYWVDKCAYGKLENYIAIEPITCSFGNNCKLDPHTRKFCSGCRLKKCFSVGMKREWILDDDQLNKRRQRRKSKLFQQQTSTPETDLCSSTSSDPLCEDGARKCQSLSVTCHSSSADNGDFAPKLPYFSSGCDSYSPLYDHQETIPQASSTYSHGWLPSPSCVSPPESINNSSPSCSLKHYHHSSLNNIPPLKHCKELDSYRLPVSEKEICSSNKYVEDEKHPFVKEEVDCENEDYSIPLSPYVQESLDSLQKTYNEIFEAAYSHEHVSKLTEKPKSADQLFNMTDMFIRRLIRFSKHISEFKSLSQLDQIALLKGGIMEMFVLRSAMSFDTKSKTWKFKMKEPKTEPEVESPCPSISIPSEGKVDSSVISTLGANMFKQHMKFVQGMIEVTGKDKIVLMLLFVIELMSPDRPHVEDKGLVSICQERHSMYLKAYLESKYTVAQARVLYPKLLMKLLDVRTLGEESCQLAACMDVTNLQPLLVEVFDLKK